MRPLNKWDLMIHARELLSRLMTGLAYGPSISEDRLSCKMNDDEYSDMAKKHGLSTSEIRRLRNQAQTPWLGASIAHLKFEALLKEAKLKKANKAKGAKNVRSESPETISDENSVKIFGSSLVGQAFGIDAFRDAEKFLTLLLGKGRLECRTPWCRACTLYKLQLSDGVVGHVMKISFPNIIKLTEVMKFSWSWERPDSEWAKSHGKASEEFQRLVSIKSKPVWYVTIQSEENIMKLLGAPTRIQNEVTLIEIYNRLIRGGTFEDSGLSEKYRKVWNDLAEEVSNRPKGSIPWPIGD